MPAITVMVKPVSGACNMRCAYCFYADEMANREQANYGRMDPATLETLVRRVYDYAEGQVNFGFQGGEPTLAGLDFYKQLLALQEKYNTRRVPTQNALQTNGYDISEPFARFLAERHFLVGVSMDGPAMLHDALRKDAQGRGTFARVQKTLKLFRRLGVEYNILCVVNGPVARDPEAVLRVLAPHEYIQFIPCLDSLEGERRPWSLDAGDYGRFLIAAFDAYEAAYRTGRPISVRIFDNYLQMLLGYPPEHCGMSGRCAGYFLVEADGSVYPCDFYALDAWRLGDIRQDSFFRLAKSEKARDFLAKSIPLDKACSACPWLSLCRGGCRREREPFLGDQPSLDRFCEGYKMFFEARYESLKSLAAEVGSR